MTERCFVKYLETRLHQAKTAGEEKIFLDLATTEKIIDVLRLATDA